MVKGTFEKEICSLLNLGPRQPYPSLSWLLKQAPRFGGEDLGYENVYETFLDHFAGDWALEGIELPMKLPKRRPGKQERMRQAEEQAKQALKDETLPDSAEIEYGKTSQHGEIEARVDCNSEATRAQKSREYADEGGSESMDISESETDNDDMMVTKATEDKLREEGEPSTVQTEEKQRCKRGLKRSRKNRRATLKQAKQAQQDVNLQSSTKEGNVVDEGLSEAMDISELEIDKGEGSVNMDISDPETDDDEALITIKTETNEPAGCELCGNTGHYGRSCPKQCPNWRCFRDLHKAKDCPLVF